MNNINNTDLERVAVYLEENYKTHYEWLNDNSAVCKEYGLTSEEFLEIVSFELANNRAATTVWKEVLSTVVGLKDGIERTSIMDFYSENCFTKEDIYDATMYASHTFSKHVIKNSHRDVIAYRFALHKKLCRTSETVEENKHVEQILSNIGLPKDNAIYFFLSNHGFVLEDASIKLNKSVEEIERDFSQAVTMVKNRQHVLFDKKVIEADNPDREAITQNILCIIKRLTPREKVLIRYLFGIPEDLNEEDFENKNNIKLEDPHTFGEASSKFGITVDRVRQIVFKMTRKGGCPRRSKRLRDYLD